MIQIQKKSGERDQKNCRGRASIIINEEKLEKYVETYYDKEEYLIRCDANEELFQIAVQHLSEEPDLETLVEDLFDTLALREARWDKQINYQEEHSYAILKKNEPANL